MQIRELGPDDAEAFWALRLRGFREEPTAFGSSYEEASRLPPEHARRLLTKSDKAPDDFVLGAFEGTSLLGIVTFERESRGKRAHRGKLRGMYVAAEARGRGIARKLIQELLARARRIPGLSQVNLTVIAQNAPAVELYRSLGFEVWGHEKDALRFGGASYDEYSMGVRL